MLKLLSVSSDLYILITVWAQKKANPDSFKPGFIQTFAESEGFEPPEQLPVHRISSAARSTTPATFRAQR